MQSVIMPDIIQIIVGEEKNTEIDLTFFSEENVENNGDPIEDEGESDLRVSLSNSEFAK